MFDKVRFAVSSITKATTEKTISQNQLNKIMEEFEIQLLESEIAFDLVKKISDELKIELGNKSISRKTEIAEVIKEKIRNSIQDIFENHKEDKIYLLTTKPYFELFKKNPHLTDVILDKRASRFNLIYLFSFVVPFFIIKYVSIYFD